MGKDPGEIREEIEDTRARMGETVEAIGYKTDVKSRATGYVSDKKDAVVSRVTGVVPDKEQAKRGARRTQQVARENPLGFAFAGAAVGFLAGLLAPSTRVEDERIGTVADDLKERVKETGQEALDRGKQVAQEAKQSAVETAKERGREHGEELASSAKETGREQSEVIASTAREGVQEGGSKPGGSAERPSPGPGAGGPATG